MNAKSTVAGLIVAVLLGVTFTGAACDVSCAFTPASADCHSTEVSTALAVGPAMNMGGMDMAGMDMPGMKDGQSHSPVSEASRAKSPHISAEIGICERQLCGTDAFVFARAKRFDAPKIPSVPLRATIRAAGVSVQVFQNAREDLAPLSFVDVIPPTFVLRI